MADYSVECMNQDLSAGFPPLDTEFLRELPNDFSFGDCDIGDIDFGEYIDFSLEDFLLPSENDAHQQQFEGINDTVGVAGDVCSPGSNSLGLDDQVSAESSAFAFSEACSSSKAQATSFSSNVNANTTSASNTHSPIADNFRKDFIRSPSNDHVVNICDHASPGSSNSFIENPGSGTNSVDSDATPNSVPNGEFGSAINKRKKMVDDGNPRSRINKLPRSTPCSEKTPSFRAGNGEEEKRKARLMRNRESAQLSRQRKKHYVEELEEKVKSLHSTVSELNAKLSYVVAENASLRQQLGGAPPAPAFCPVPAAGPIHFPWVPFSSYPVKLQGSQVPLVPIPRLKPQQPATAPKTKKSETKKSESKTKKVASVSLLGVFFFFFLFGGFFPFASIQHGQWTSFHKLDFTRNFPKGRVFPIMGHMNGTNHGSSHGLGRHPDKAVFRRANLEYGNDKEGRNCEMQQNDIFGFSPNSNEPLLASLYVPRNDKLVKIDGNLIIRSVLASERAVASKHEVTGRDREKSSLTGKSTNTDLAVPDILMSALALSNIHQDAGRSSSFGVSAHRMKALGSHTANPCNDNMKSPPEDGLMHQWFKEGLTGPLLSAGMCTELFQFNVSSISNAVVPANSVANLSERHPDSVHPRRMKNRRILHYLPVPLQESGVSDTAKQPEGFTESNDRTNSSSSSLVVSVLVDPSETDEIDREGVMPPKSKSFSRIFVVVLLDSVKYVTYSCVLPLKSSTGLHLVSA